MSCANCDCKYCVADREDEYRPTVIDRIMDNLEDPVIRAMWSLMKSCHGADRKLVRYEIRTRVNTLRNTVR